MYTVAVTDSHSEHIHVSIEVDTANRCDCNASIAKWLRSYTVQLLQLATACHLPVINWQWLFQLRKHFCVRNAQEMRVNELVDAPVQKQATEV